MSTPRADLKSREAFIMALGAALHRWGIPAHRLEARMTDVADRLELSAQFFSTPTVLMAGFGSTSAQSVRLVRIDPGTVDLSKLLDLDNIAESVARGSMSADEGFEQVRAVDERPPLYRGGWVVLAFGLVAAGAARFFNAGIVEAAAAFAAGLLAGTLGALLPRLPRSANHLFELLAAFCVTMSVAGMQAAGVRVAPFPVILSGLIVLVPGLTLTVAVSELATKNLVSGSARLVSAGMSLLQIAFGVALAQEIALLVFGPLESYGSAPLPPWSQAVALVVLSAALTVLFQAPLRLMPAITLVTTIAVAGARLGTTALTPQLSASVGAFAVTLVGNGFARLRGRPAVVLIVPGLLVLVPGSLGFKSVNSLLADDPTMGVETAFDMGVVAVAIVAGLLVANVVLPPGRGPKAGSSL